MASTMGITRGRSPVDDREIGVAQPGCGHFHQHLARAGGVKLYRLDADRLGFGVGLRYLHLVEHGGADLHVFSCNS